MSNFLRLFLAAFCLLTFSTSAAIVAQSTTGGAIGGVVKDPQGAVVPNASVSARNVETNAEGKAITDSSCGFRVVQLQPGNYTITVNATGFTAYVQQNIVVEVGRVTPIDISLSVSGAHETVQVTSEAP